MTKERMKDKVRANKGDTSPPLNRGENIPAQYPYFKPPDLSYSILYTSALT